MSARTIFNRHQEFVAVWTEQLTNHEANLSMLGAKLAQAAPNDPSSEAIASSAVAVTIQACARIGEDPLNIFGSIPEGVDPQEDLRKRGLIVLTFLIDEIMQLRWRIDDDENLALYDQRSVAKRITALVGNLVKQGCALVQTRILFKGRLERLKSFWLALAEGIAGIFILSRRPSSRDDVLFTSALESLSKDVESLPLTERHLFSDQGIRVLKQWCDTAITCTDVFRCASLYLVLRQVGYKDSLTPLLRVHALGDKVSALIPVISGRRATRLEDFLLGSLKQIPSYASKLSTDLSSQRKSHARILESNFDDYAKRLCHELVAKQDIVVAEKIRHLIFSLLHTHSIEKISLPKNILNSLLTMIETLTGCEESLMRIVGVLPNQIVPQGSSIPMIAQTLLKGCRTLSPTSAIALSLALNLDWDISDSASFEPLVSDIEHNRRVVNCSNVADLISPFGELYEPFLKIVTRSDLMQLPRRLPAIIKAFRNLDQARLRKGIQEWIVELLFEEVDQVLRSRVVMKESKDTDLKGFIVRTMRLRIALNCPPLDLSGNGDEIVTIRAEVSRRLTRSWHEMRCTGIDRTWDTYAEMQIIAQEYFGLDIYLDELAPAITTVTGCDILEIARDVQDFAVRFNYNMNQEFFIERRPHGKYVNLITIDSLTKSLRGHGLGVLSSVVNVVYQFLAGKFEQFSQCLFDDLIKSFLKRERRWMAKEQTSSAGCFYPFDRATDFSTNVKLPSSYLSRIRMIVSEIGNAFGFVRCVRASALRWAGTVHRFSAKDSSVLPKDEESMVNRTLAGHLNDVAFKQVPDYMQILVDVFRKIELHKSDHLKNAFMIVPALCVDFVDASLFAKDQVARAHKNPNREAYFTDDGFVMGIAAILAMLQQDMHFDSLKFFKGVAAYFETTTEQAAQKAVHGSSAFSELASAAGLDQPSNDLVAGLSKRRHRGAAREYELLMYALSGARVFFKRDMDDSKGSESKEKGNSGTPPVEVEHQPPME